MTPAYQVTSSSITSTLEEWTSVTVDEVDKLIAAALNKTCQLDPASTRLVTMCEHLAPFVALLFNRSLVTGCFPREFKQAVVRSSVSEEERTGCERNEKLQDCLKFFLPLQIVGEGCPGQTAGFSW